MKIMVFILGAFLAVQCVLALSPSLVYAGDLRGQIDNQIKAGTKGAGIQGGARDPQELVVSAIQVFLSILGMVFLILVLLAGFWYVTAKGDESKVEKAQSTIQSAVIGLAVILMAYTITHFVGKKFSAAVSEGGSTTNVDVQIQGRCNYSIDGRQEYEDDVTEHECLRCTAPRYGCAFASGGGEQGWLP